MIETASSSSQERLRRLATLREHRFRSQIPVIGPLIAGLRAAWNAISTKWYVRDLMMQQSAFNLALLDELEIACQRVEHLTQEHGRLATRLGDWERRAGLSDVRLHDHDAWLIQQDHEASMLAVDLAEARLHIVQLRRTLAEAEAQASEP